MSPELVVIDRTVSRRPRRLEREVLAACCRDVRGARGWWAGQIEGSDDAAPEALAPDDVAVLAEDPAGRMVVWVANEERSGETDPAEVAEALVAGSGPVWRPRRPAKRSPARGWRALRRAHARALLGQACGLSDPLCRRLRHDDPSSVRRAVRAWLNGDEGLAVQLVHSAVAARIAAAETGYAVDERFGAKLFDADPATFYDGGRWSPPGRGVDA